MKPSEVDAMWWDETEDLLGYWGEHPPMHVLAAAYLGVSPKPSGPGADGPPEGRG